MTSKQDNLGIQQINLHSSRSFNKRVTEYVGCNETEIKLRSDYLQDH